MSDLYLGIDTSNYKTSVALADGSGRIVLQKSEFLEVPRGSRGMRQSEAFFRHSCRLPGYIRELCSEADPRSIRAAGVSSRPRRAEGSYMPCFLAGVNAASEIASVLGIPLYEFSHQEGHAAAVIECGREFSGSPARGRDTVLMHLSGGTTEFLRCRQDQAGYDLEIIGGTRDISIGQLFDRAGVAMGYDFPSGMYLDELAGQYAGEGHLSDKPGIPAVKTSGGYFNLSGPETQVMRWIENSSPDEYPFIAFSLFDRIAELLAVCASEAADTADTDTVYMAGGVSSSSFIREITAKKLDMITQGPGRRPMIIFGEPALSGDNAAGTAILARRIHTHQQTDENSHSNTSK